MDRSRRRRALRACRRQLVYPALALLLPTDCFGCGRDLGPLQYLGACPGCWCSLRPPRAPVCVECALPLPAGTDLEGPAAGRCARCVIGPRLRCGRVRAAVPYDELARRFMLRAKLGRRRELLAPLGRQLARVLAHGGLAREADAVVAVPTHPWMLLRRGFNPAAELARRVARGLGLPLIRRALVRRMRAGRPAKRLRAAQRRRVSREAFAGRRSLRDLRILLVDDVLTTGATAEACGAALRAAGAREVRVAVWARTPLRRDPPV